MARAIRQYFSFLLGFTLLLGLLYPAAVTLFAKLVLPWRSNGSVIFASNRPAGSQLIGQQFTRPEYFWSRPSATTPSEYNASSSAASNLGPLNPALRDSVRARVEALRSADPGNQLPIPIDLVTSSGSGLDPHISPASAFYQTARVARHRGIPEERVRRLVEQHIEKSWLEIFGAPRVNVLMLNLELDRTKRD